ncbi:MAG: hypothetical protein OJF50_004936 [Nitrospira sp.]|nr:hypothetical protein [Nitrospira sp.]
MTSSLLIVGTLVIGTVLGVLFKLPYADRK